MTIKDWSTTAASNNAAVPEGAPEGWLFADVNNVVRQVMAHLRTWYNDAAWIEYGDGDGAYTTVWIGVNSIRIDGSDQTSQYHANRRIRITGSISGVTTGNITSSSFAASNTTVNVSNTLNATNETISKVEILSVRADNSGVALLVANNTLTGANEFTKASAAGAKPAISLGSGAVNPGWGSLYVVQQTGARSYIARVSDTVYIANNAYNDNASWRAIITGKGSLIRFYGGSGIGNEIDIFQLDDGAGGNVSAGGVYTLSARGSLVDVEASGSVNTLVRRNSGGHIFNTFFNMTADDISTATPSRVPVEIGTDGFLRWQTLANFKNIINLPTFTAVSATPLPINALSTFAHGLVTKPSKWKVMLECMAADESYAIGDLIDITSIDSDGTRACTVSADATNIYVRFNNTAPAVVNKTTGGYVALTVASWRLSVAASK